MLGLGEFDWYGNHTIGIIGSSNSGKTVFLTSLLWHLQKHSQDRFYLKKGSVKDFKLHQYGDKKHDFNLPLHQNTLTVDHRWPDKTTDYAVADCTYSSKERWWPKHVKFVDIPGERVSDISIWKANNYREWVENLFDSWANNPKFGRIMKPYLELASRNETSLAELAKAYKEAMWSILESYCQITPSTYLLGTDGSQLGDKDNKDRETAIRSRPIWSGGELLPLPESWCEAHLKESSDMVATFKKYKREVLEPLFDEIDDCENFIFCVDIPGILNNGPACLNDTQRTFDDFIEYFAPNIFGRWLHNIGNKPRLAYVATKSDLVLNKDNLKKLLMEFSVGFEGFEVEYFTCSACVSCKEGGDVPFDEWPTGWEPGVYFPEVEPPKHTGDAVARPPRQVNVNKILDFIMEGVSEE